MFVIAFIFSGCGDSSDESSPLDQYSDYFSTDPKTYDYYEIADGEILHTDINTDYVNVARVYDFYNSRHMTEYKRFVENYHISNEALNIDRYEDVYIENYLDLETDNGYSTIHIYGYGLYEIKTNYCIVNTDVDNCNTYIYTNKI
jgi:hypothetical protein